MICVGEGVGLRAPHARRRQGEQRRALVVDIDANGPPQRAPACATSTAVSKTSAHSS